MLTWRKSSYSGNNGGMCIEVALPVWQKSSHSGDNGGCCVEVALGFLPGAVPVRDSKDPQGPSLLFPDSSWNAFVAAVRAGELPIEG
ncbi:DUF397 domain-containing protein [Kitasatospora sp. NPDC057518]|uniref:DUF397 domain-containing protein n=1 Tax=Kitasatospora sp. NPDC057518 TaxID=3346155 RepID=UPI0036C2BF2E